jgi:hypothetical protein
MEAGSQETSRSSNRLAADVRAPQVSACLPLADSVGKSPFLRRIHFFRGAGALVENYVRAYMSTLTSIEIIPLDDVPPAAAVITRLKFCGT